MLQKFLLVFSVVISAIFLSCSDDSVTGTTNDNTEIVEETIVVNKNAIYLAIGQEEEVSATISSSPEDNSDLSWCVYNPNVSSVENGKIKGLSCGKTTVVVSGKEATCEIQVVVRNLEKNQLRIHFRTEENTPESYKEFGILLMGSALPQHGGNKLTYIINDTLYDFRNFLQFQQIDSFGMYTEISVQDNKDFWAGIMRNNQWFDNFSDMSRLYKVDLLSLNELWFIEGVNQIFFSKPTLGLIGLKISGEDRIVTESDSVDLQLTPVPSTVPLSSVSWQTSNQFIAEVDSNGKVTGKMPGTAVISALSGGLVVEKTVSVVPVVADAFVRVHYRRYLKDYETWFIETQDDRYSFVNFDAYGAFIDLPAKPELNFSLKTEFEVALDYSGTPSGNNELWLLQGNPNVLTARPTMDVGAFKIANSWSDKSYQNGRNWEHVIDGFFYMSYDALKKSNVCTYYLAAKKAYKPRMIAVFNIEGNYRGEFRIRFGAGDTTSPRQIKHFLGYPFLSYGTSYASEFPATDMVCDITEFLPLCNENVFMEIRDGAYNRTLKINKFTVEIYDDYSAEPVQTVSDSGFPAYSADGGVTRFIIENLAIAENATLAKQNTAKKFELTQRPLSHSDFEGYTPSPARIPEDQLRNLANNGKIKILDKVILTNNYLAKSTVVNKIDNSKSPHFPPVGSQERKGSCTAWAFGYYLATYNIARKNNWDLSGAQWINGSISDDYKSKIMSPDFLYNLINQGNDDGSDGYFATLVLGDIGIASMNTAPIIYNNVVSWPDEAAFREAPANRHDESSLFYSVIKTDQDVENIKNLLKAGELVAIAIQASGMTLSDNDTYTEQNAGNSLDHMVTVVGFDDNWTLESEE